MSGREKNRRREVLNSHRKAATEVPEQPQAAGPKKHGFKALVKKFAKTAFTGQDKSRPFTKQIKSSDLLYHL